MVLKHLLTTKQGSCFLKCISFLCLLKYVAKYSKPFEKITLDVTHLNKYTAYDNELSLPKLTAISLGQVGDWKNHLTVSQSELIDANVERVLGDTDVTFTYQ